MTSNDRFTDEWNTWSGNTHRQVGISNDFDMQTGRETERDRETDRRRITDTANRANWLTRIKICLHHNHINNN